MRSHVTRILFENSPNLYLPSSQTCICRPPGAGASGLQRRQGACSLRDRQPPTALPALDRTFIRRHGANTRPKGHSGPSACSNKHLCTTPEPAFTLKSVRTCRYLVFRPTIQYEFEKSRSDSDLTNHLTDEKDVPFENIGRFVRENGI